MTDTADPNVPSGGSKLRMSLSEARQYIDALIDAELEAGEDGNARLDCQEIQALGVASTVLSDVMHADVLKYLV